MRRGAALLIAMLVLLVSVAISASLVRTAWFVDIAERRSAGLTQSRTLISDARTLIESDAPALAAAIGDGSRGDLFIEVLRIERESHTLTARVIDLSGRLHVDQLESNAARGLPEDFGSLRAHEASEKLASLGIRPTIDSLLTDPNGSDQSVRMFPSIDGNADGTSRCEWVTTAGSGALNVRTAPLPLLIAALEGTSPTVAAKVLTLRRANEPIPSELIGALARNNRSDPASVWLTGASSALGAIITLQTQGMVARWWMVLEFSRDPNSRRGPRWRTIEFRRIG